MVTTSDRLEVPPIAHFCHLVRQLAKSSQSEILNKQVQFASNTASVSNTVDGS
jgi:hypothetical protein